MRYMKKTTATALILLMVLIINEMIFFTSHSTARYLPYIFAIFSISLSIPIALTVTIPKKTVPQTVSGTVLLSLMSVFFITETVLKRSFGYAYPIGTVLDMADSVLNSYGTTVLSAIASSIKYIALYLIPPIAFAILYPKIPTSKGKRHAKTVLPTVLFLSAVSVVAYITGIKLIGTSGDASYIYGEGYEFDSAAREFGLNTALVFEIKHSLFPQSAYIPRSEAEPVKATHSDDFSEDRYNMLLYPEFDLSDNIPDTVRSLHNYVLSRKPTVKNQKTGIFQNKNLIFVCAEALSPYAVSPTLTPTLYKMQNEGISFQNYYSPCFGESTSGGEYALLLSMIPKRRPGEKGLSMQLSAKNDLSFSLPAKFKSIGYSCNGYHNNSYTYYGRNTTHPAMGMNWYGCGGCVTVDAVAEKADLSEQLRSQWPRSDIELISATVDRYTNISQKSNAPFFTYYLTVSGHNNYNFSGNAISRKNRDIITDTNHSEAVSAYLAAQKELDLAMETLLSALEERGILDETVIVIANDHHPYGLSASWAGNNGNDYLSELYGSKASAPKDIEKGFFTVYCHGYPAERITKPVSSFDVLPTLLNMFGIKFDSRIYCGSDVFSDTVGRVFFSDGSFITEKGYYDQSTRSGFGLSEDDISETKKSIRELISFSLSARQSNYFSYIPK